MNFDTMITNRATTRLFVEFRARQKFNILKFELPNEFELDKIDWYTYDEAQLEVTWGIDIVEEGGYTSRQSEYIGLIFDELRMEEQEWYDYLDTLRKDKEEENKLKAALEIKRQEQKDWAEYNRLKIKLAL